MKLGGYISCMNLRAHVDPIDCLPFDNIHDNPQV
jgi:hypothetical protein